MILIMLTVQGAWDFHAAFSPFAVIIKRALAFIGFSSARVIQLVRALLPPSLAERTADNAFSVAALVWFKQHPAYLPPKVLTPLMVPTCARTPARLLVPTAHLGELHAAATLLQLLVPHRSTPSSLLTLPQPYPPLPDYHPRPYYAVALTACCRSGSSGTVRQQRITCCAPVGLTGRPYTHR